ncbi:MAG: helix-turn-helix transcriptional regulator [Casimicrobiaceae bacterium]
MGHTTHRDLKLAVDLIGAISAHSGATALARAGVEKLPQLVSSELTTLSICTLKTGHRRVVSNPVGALSEGDIACFDRFFYEHPLVRYHANNPDGPSHRITDSLTPRIFHRTALFNDYYRNVGIDHVIAVPLFADSSLLVSFVLNRKGRDFSERDREILDLVRRPLAALYRNAMALDSVQQALARVAADDADEGWMLVALDSSRRITSIASRLEPWFASAFGATRTGIGTLLPEAIDRAVASQYAAIDAALALRAAAGEVSGSGGRCTVQALWRGDESRDALLLIRRVGPGPAPMRPTARDDLTVREREVLEWVGAGKTNAQIAEILSASPRTVGKHLENVYAKLGVETRTAAVNRGLN